MTDTVERAAVDRALVSAADAGWISYETGEFLAEGIRALPSAAGGEDKLREELECAAVDLEQAAAMLADWGAYASEYFQKKHSLARDVADLNESALRVRAALQQEPTK